MEHIALDPDQCYRVLDLNFAKEDLKIYLASGYLIFAKPIGGAHLGAIFVTSEEAGDADLLLLPPTRSERTSLARFTGSPTLDEHFRVAAFIFTDGTGDQLFAQLEGSSSAKKSPDMGSLMAGRWTTVLADLVASFETRVVYDILSDQPDNGVFYIAVSGNELKNFDVLVRSHGPGPDPGRPAGPPRQSHVLRYLDQFSGAIVPRRRGVRQCGTAARRALRAG